MFFFSERSCLLRKVFSKRRSCRKNLFEQKRFCYSQGGSECSMAKRYVLTNQKGGVSKSQMSLTSAVMSWVCGKRVLLVDLDPQSNITLSSGCNPNAVPATIYDVMRG